VSFLGCENRYASYVLSASKHLQDTSIFRSIQFEMIIGHRGKSTDQDDAAHTRVGRSRIIISRIRRSVYRRLQCKIIGR
jgi:hypothetical protein